MKNSSSVYNLKYVGSNRASGTRVSKSGGMHQASAEESLIISFWHALWHDPYRRVIMSWRNISTLNIALCYGAARIAYDITRRNIPIALAYEHAAYGVCCGNDV